MVQNNELSVESYRTSWTSSANEAPLFINGVVCPDNFHVPSLVLLIARGLLVVAIGTFIDIKPLESIARANSLIVTVVPLKDSGTDFNSTIPRKSMAK